MKHKIIVTDMDGTLCEEVPTFERSMAKPNQESIEFINKSYALGAHIIIYTSRSWAEYRMTKTWLDSSNVKYHQLICGKPIYDVWLDDKSIKPKEQNELKRLLREGA